ncbi:AAA family ATPase [Methanosphaera sp. WGK6]|uniref:AAA family ATPase n=1 Tax=Methanosphaera sp. WGK6 TaxID=1561964 RepID=UPI00084C6275|nr:AAA family ATPase [Methanosphaera sp. WGK6]
MEYLTSEEASKKLKRELETIQIPDYEYHYEKFQEKYSPENLRKLEGADVLNTIFMHDGTSNLCQDMEFNKDYRNAGAIWGGSAFKFSLFKNKDGIWKYGTHPSNVVDLTEDEAIETGLKIRDDLVKACDLIKKTSLDCVEDYENLEKEFELIFEDTTVKAGHAWVHKYFHMIFPDKFTNVHTRDKRVEYLNNFNLSSTNSTYGDDGKLINLAKISNISVRKLNNFFVFKFKSDEIVESQINHSKHSYWLLAPGKKGRKWDLFKENNIIAIGWDKLGDLSNLDKNSIKDIYNEAYNPQTTPWNDIKTIDDFVNNIQVGDIVIVKKGRSTVLGYGEVTSNYTYDESFSSYNHVRHVNWIYFNECDTTGKLSKLLSMKTLTNITGNIDDASGKYLYEVLLDLINEDVFTSELSVPTYTRDDFLDDVIFKEEDYDKIIKLLKRNKNIILQGAPGVGKTFISKRIAYSLIGIKEDSQVEFIQFHQSYSYEDFIQGYKPTEDGFKLRNGVFYNFVKKALNNPDKDYFFIIDEINRGNISKIFGELLMLIEKDKRGSEYSISLTYSDEKFSVPENLYLIGLMNTADRSLAIMDYALRRRFVFYTVKPLFGEDNFRNYLLSTGVDEKLVHHIISVFTSLNRDISQDMDLGEGFEVGHSHFITEDTLNVDDYMDIIDFDIAPQLREYYFDDVDKAEVQIRSLKFEN